MIIKTVEIAEIFLARNITNLISYSVKRTKRQQQARDKLVHIQNIRAIRETALIKW